MINARLQGVARTLALTLRARANEQDRQTPLINDPWSAQWYKHLPQYEDYDSWYNPTFQLATVIRTAMLDEVTTTFLRKHPGALVVELGSGFSTRYYRTDANQATWVELDLEDVIVVRRKLDVETAKHWFIASDISKIDWLDKLPEHESEAILFLAEGVLMFSEAQTVSDLFASLSNHYHGATFAFDVVNPGYVEHVQEDFQLLNAPMLWGITEDQLSDYNLDVQSVQYLLSEFGDRWDEIGVSVDKRQQDRSGYVVESILV